MEIIYEKKVLKEDLKVLSQKVKNSIKIAIEEKLLIHPEYYSIPLKGTLKPLRKFKVGNYRVVHMIEGERIKVYAIKHRKHIYKNL